MGDPSKKKLNKEQLAAIQHKNGPLLIIAGAGTGKTTVVTERIKYLVEKGFAKPSEILALTFTEKAAQEMQERVDIAMPYGYTQMWISTFHSFCDRVLRAEALEIGLNPRYKLISEAIATQLVRDNLFKFDLNYFRPLGNPTKFISGMLAHFSRLQDEDVSPKEYQQWVDKKLKVKKQTEEEKLDNAKWKELSSAYKTYDDLKTKGGYMDFGDLIAKTLKLFRERKNVLLRYQNLFKYILVDEFQDTNFAQNQMALLLSEKSKNINVCGDDDQSIYRFRGAAISNIIQFRKHFKKVKIVTLTKNYRSTQEILDRSYDLIQNNNPDRLEVAEKVDKHLVSQRKEKGDEISLIHANRVENEAEEVSRKVKELVKSGKYDYKDFAVLVRANDHSEPFMRAFSRLGVPYQFLGPGRLFKQEEVVDLISYLKVLNNFEDSVSLYRILANPYFEIPATDLVRLGNYTKKNYLSLYETCKKIGDINVSVDSCKKITKIIEIIDMHFSLLHKDSAGQILYSFLENTGLLKYLLNPDSLSAEKRALNVSKFFDKLKSYEVDHEDATVSAVVDWIDLSSEIGESPLAADTDWSQNDAVNILTVHSSKGLEFPVVFLVNLVSLRFPTVERREQVPIPDGLVKELLPKGDFHQQEERRLFYVGMTRAKDKLFLTAANYYGEGKRDKKLSPFIFEAIGDRAAASEIKSEEKQLSFVDYQEKIFNKSVEKNITKSLHIDYLSYSQIETFKICPLHYKLRYVYKIPSSPSPAQSFGNSFHLTMKNFYEMVQKKQKPDKDMLYKILEENWIKEGYLEKSHERSSFNKAKKFLNYYLENYFDPKVTPLSLEQKFTVRIDNLLIGGKIDRVDLFADKLRIIDYKTGSHSLTQREADRDLQLSIYALAATSIKDYPFKNINPEKIELMLYYFEDPKIVVTSRTRKQLEEAKKIILDYKKQIEESDFKCSKSILCRSCEYKLFCNVETDE